MVAKLIQVSQRKNLSIQITVSHFNMHSQAQPLRIAELREQLLTSKHLHKFPSL